MIRTLIGSGYKGTGTATTAQREFSHPRGAPEIDLEFGSDRRLPARLKRIFEGGRGGHDKIVKRCGSLLH
jgi:hypothetical protein